MCVAALAWQAHPQWRLVAIGNRDELHDRPAAALHRWPGGATIAGQDLVGRGTWLGASEQGRFVLVTNRRGFGNPDPAKRSRGELATAMLDGAGPPAPLDDYNPFNLLCVGEPGLEYLTNRPVPLRTGLGHGVYGLSNGALDEPWPKTLALKQAVTDWLADGRDDLEPLFGILRSEDRPALGLPAHEPSDIGAEPRDTPPFIRHPLYGTRCSTVVTVTASGHASIAERRFRADGSTEGETRIDFAWPPRLIPPETERRHR